MMRWFQISLFRGSSDKLSIHRGLVKTGDTDASYLTEGLAPEMGAIRRASVVRELGYATTSFSPSWRSSGAMVGLFRECGDVQRDIWVQIGEGCYLHGGVTLCSKLAPSFKERNELP